MVLDQEWKALGGGNTDFYVSARYKQKEDEA
jgi:hypothetical protein